jgi:hypothetical protein
MTKSDAGDLGVAVIVLMVGGQALGWLRSPRPEASTLRHWLVVVQLVMGFGLALAITRFAQLSVTAPSSARGLRRRGPPASRTRRKIDFSLRAGVVKLADARDSKSRGVHSPCGFDSHLRHHFSLRNLAIQRSTLAVATAGRGLTLTTFYPSRAARPFPPPRDGDRSRVLARAERRR